MPAMLTYLHSFKVRPCGRGRLAIADAIVDEPTCDPVDRMLGRFDWHESANRTEPAEVILQRLDATIAGFYCLIIFIAMSFGLGDGLTHWSGLLYLTSRAMSTTLLNSLWQYAWTHHRHVDHQLRSQTRPPGLRPQRGLCQRARPKSSTAPRACIRHS